MAPRLVSDAQLDEQLLSLFRANGFAGVSLTDLQEATGLKRSSLYHRFPGGKLEMATTILDRVTETLATDVFGTVDTDQTPERQVETIGTQLTQFYGDGRLSCLVETMSIGNPPPEIAERTAAAIELWVAGFARLAQRPGVSAATARTRAIDAVAAVEGALVIARTTGDTDAFTRAIDSLPNRLLG
jgi:TetR/AcrR family transcriptional repressor of lmrAB and yxaGH operons